MMTWPFPQKTISPSSMAKFQRCPEQWRRQYLLGQWGLAAASAVVGSAVHESAQVNYRQKAMSWEDLSVNDIETVYLEAFDREVDERGGPSEVEWTMNSRDGIVHLSPGKAKDKGVPLARKYHEDVASTVTPVAAEEWFRIEVPDVPVPVRGKIDLIEGDETGAPIQKNDLKFGRSAKREAEPSWRLQAMTYMLVDETTSSDGSVRFDGLAGLPFGWHTGSWGGPRSDPKIYVPDTSPGLVIPFEGNTEALAHAHIQATVSNMIDLYDRFGPEEPWPTHALMHTWACNYCSFYPRNGGNCYWWSGVKEPVLTLL